MLRVDRCGLRVKARAFFIHVCLRSHLVATEQFFGPPEGTLSFEQDGGGRSDFGLDLIGQCLGLDKFSVAGADSSYGRVFARALFKAVLREKPWLLPYAVINTATKWLGYQVGAAGRGAPEWLKRTCSGQDYYWTSTFYHEGRSV